MANTWHNRGSYGIGVRVKGPAEFGHRLRGRSNFDFFQQAFCVGGTAASPRIYDMIDEAFTDGVLE